MGEKFLWGIFIENGVTLKKKMDPRQLGHDSGRQIEMAQDYMEDRLLYQLC